MVRLAVCVQGRSFAKNSGDNICDINRTLTIINRKILHIDINMVEAGLLNNTTPKQWPESRFLISMTKLSAMELRNR